MYFGDFHLMIRGKRALVCLLVLLAAHRLRAADEKASAASKTPTVVKPATSSVTRQPEQLAPEGLFNQTTGPNVPLMAPRPPVIPLTPAEQEKIDRRKNWITQTPGEAFGGLSLKDSSGEKRTGLGNDLEARSPDSVKRFLGTDAGEAAASMSLDHSRNRGGAGESGTSVTANRQETVPGELDLEALLKKSSSGDRWGLSGGGFPGAGQGNSGFQFEAKQKEQRDVRMNDYRQLFNSTAVQPASGAASRSGLGNPTLDPLRNTSPRATSESSAPLRAQPSSQDPRIRPAQAGVNHLPSLDVADPRNPVANPSSSAATLDESNREKPVQQPARLPFPKRVF